MGVGREGQEAASFVKDIHTSSLLPPLLLPKPPPPKEGEWRRECREGGRASPTEERENGS